MNRWKQLGAGIVTSTLFAFSSPQQVDAQVYVTPKVGLQYIDQVQEHPKVSMNVCGEVQFQEDLLGYRGQFCHSVTMRAGTPIDNFDYEVGVEYGNPFFASLSVGDRHFRRWTGNDQVSGDVPYIAVGAGVRGTWEGIPWLSSEVEMRLMKVGEIKSAPEGYRELVVPGGVDPQLFVNIGFDVSYVGSRLGKVVSRAWKQLVE